MMSKKEKKGQIKRKIKPHVKNRIYKIIIVVNIIWVLLMISYYGFRLIYFYKLEHKSVSKTNDFAETLTLNKNIVNTGDGLYSVDKKYIYKGKVTNNYVYYSGLYYRIMSIEADASIKLISEESLTTLAYGINGYDKSIIKNWLVPTKGVPHTGIFLANLDDVNNYLTKTKTCVDIINNIKKNSCSKVVSDYSGLISLSEYSKARGSNSYLNNGSAFYTSSVNKDKQAYSITKSGKISSVSNNGDTYNSYGVRPTITLKSKTKLISGDGTITNPYIIQNKKKTNLRDTNIGEYVYFSNNRYRVIAKHEGVVKLIMDGTINQLDTFDKDSVLFDMSSYYNIGYYLNNRFLKTYQNREFMRKGIFYTGTYSDISKYDYLNTFASTTEAYIGLPSVGDYFIADYDSFTITPTNAEAEMINTISDNKLFADIITNEHDVRPVIYLDSNLLISGNGTKVSPYEVGAV